MIVQLPVRYQNGIWIEDIWIEDIWIEDLWLVDSNLSAIPMVPYLNVPKSDPHCYFHFFLEKYLNYVPLISF